MRPAFAWALFAMALLLVAIVLWPVYPGGGHSARRTAALSNMKQVSLALLMYLEDSDHVYPPCDTWGDDVMPYVKNAELFVSQFDEKTVLSPAMNALLDKKALRRTSDPARVVTLFQVVGPARNAWGGPIAAWEGYGENHTVHTAYADSHVKSVQRQKLSGLQWRP